MPLKIVRNDITKMQVDAIVNAANESLLGGGGVDGCIHRAAGPGLLAECRTLGGCKTGGAKVTGAYNLPCKYVIHAVGPQWQGGNHKEREALVSCYETSLNLALELGCETVAFPLISSGIYGYPKDEALTVAMDTIRDFLFEQDMTVYIVIFDKKAYQIGEKLFSDITQYIDDHYVEQHSDEEQERRRCLLINHTVFAQECCESADDALPESEEEISREKTVIRQKTADSSKKYFKTAPLRSLDEAVEQLDESFSEMLLRKIDERGITDTMCYKRANIDRKLFSKIRSDKFYKPSKPTVLAFAIALELSLEETKEMLGKAGFALSHSNKFDIIIEYFICQGKYDMIEINEALFCFDQGLLGS